MFPNAAGGGATIQPGDPRMGRRPPFNSIPEYREPGKINLNTIFSSAVYAGLFHSSQANANDVQPEPQPAAAGTLSVHAGPRWSNNDDSLVRSRRGYDPVGTPANGGDPKADILSLNPNFPTFFANPFRPANSGNLVPLANMVRNGIECTMLRSTSASTNAVDDKPLFAGNTSSEFNNADRNPFFRYAPLTRLENLVTNRSNVYAVWITIGFFEVQDFDTLEPTMQQAALKGIDPNATTPTNLSGAAAALFKQIYPDNYTIGKEDGLDEGKVQRLRGFYIIDRSRPAGFQPGVDVNADKTIRLRRRIE
jgi:hypothetical protein